MVRTDFMRVILTPMPWSAATSRPPISHHRRYNRVEMPEIRHSVCALDCPDCCSLLVTVENGRGTRLRGDPAHPVTRGFLCGKVAQYLEREYSPERLLYPQRRVGAKGEGRFERISWDEALDTIAERLHAVADEFGSEAILPYSYAGTMGLLNGGGMDRRFFHRLGASRLDRTICSSAGGAGLTQALGVRYGTEPEQFRHSKLILAWGANILGTNVHLWPFIVEARRNGAKFYTIDPHRNRTGAASRQAFLHQSGQRYRAGAGDDARHHWRRAARRRLRGALYRWFRRPARASPRMDSAARGRTHRHRRRRNRTTGARVRHHAAAVIRLNYGVQRSERGATAMRTIALLPALTGSWKDVGRRPAAFHLAGVPLKSRRPGARRLQQVRWAAKRAS